MSPHSPAPRCSCRPHPRRLSSGRRKALGLQESRWQRTPGPERVPPRASNLLVPQTQAPSGRSCCPGKRTKWSPSERPCACHSVSHIPPSSHCPPNPGRFLVLLPVLGAGMEEPLCPESLRLHGLTCPVEMPNFRGHPRGPGHWSRPHPDMTPSPAGKAAACTHLSLGGCGAWGSYSRQPDREASTCCAPWTPRRLCWKPETLAGGAGGGMGGMSLQFALCWQSCAEPPPEGGREGREWSRPWGHSEHAPGGRGRRPRATRGAESTGPGGGQAGSRLPRGCRLTSRLGRPLSQSGGRGLRPPAPCTGAGSPFLGPGVPRGAGPDGEVGGSLWSCPASHGNPRAQASEGGVYPDDRVLIF